MNQTFSPDTTPETWDFMQEKGLNDAHIDTGPLDLTSVGITKTYFPLLTPVRQACEIWGLIYNFKLGVLATQQPINSGALPTISGRNMFTYTQPQPPATNSTTDAATTGNLQFRNGFLDVEWFYSQGIFQGATLGVQNGAPAIVQQGQIFLKKPRRIACSQLETQIIIGGIFDIDSTSFELTADFLYRFVTVSESEYNALVALSSGQAVLTEVIVA